MNLKRLNNKTNLIRFISLIRLITINLAKVIKIRHRKLSFETFKNLQLYLFPDY